MTFQEIHKISYIFSSLEKFRKFKIKNRFNKISSKCYCLDASLIKHLLGIHILLTKNIVYQN